MKSERLVIEIRKAGFTNKGAELMLMTIWQFLKKEFPNAKLVMEPYHSTSPYEKRAKLGLWQKPRLYRFGIQFGFLFNILPKFLRNMLGITLDREVDVVLDASGFSYSDQWGTQSISELKNSATRWSKQRTLVILMPQAFGPFLKGKNKRNIKQALKLCHSVYVRDAVSHAYLQQAGVQENILKMAPDFTNQAISTSDSFQELSNRVAIIPNLRMLDKTGPKGSAQYLKQLEIMAHYLESSGERPFFLIHDDLLDKIVCDKVSENLNFDIETVTSTCPFELKSILGNCKLVIGSRYHALIGALSQGVPSISIGWSHKYVELFNDYEIPELLLDLDKDDGVAIVKNALSDPNYNQLKKRVTKNANLNFEKSHQMFQDIRTKIEQHARSINK